MIFIATMSIDHDSNKRFALFTLSSLKNISYIDFLIITPASGLKDIVNVEDDTYVSRFLPHLSIFCEGYFAALFLLLHLCSFSMLMFFCFRGSNDCYWHSLQQISLLIEFASAILRTASLITWRFFYFCSPQRMCLRDFMCCTG